MGLNYNWSAHDDAGQQHVARTAIPTRRSVLQLGWMSLVGGGPFPAASDGPELSYQQVIILLTDGLNTQDRWYTSQSSIDARQQLTCNNIKAAGITLYTIQVNTGGDPTSTLLQNCASTSDKFYLLTQANQITATFQAIGTNLTELPASPNNALDRIVRTQGSPLRFNKREYVHFGSIPLKKSGQYIDVARASEIEGALRLAPFYFALTATRTPAHETLGRWLYRQHGFLAAKEGLGKLAAYPAASAGMFSFTKAPGWSQPINNHQMTSESSQAINVALAKTANTPR